MSIFHAGAGAALCALALLAAPLAAGAQPAPAPAAAKPPVDGPSDIPESFARPEADNDYVKRVEMVPMRDGVKLYTVIVTPKGAKGLPIILTRTPYNAKNRAKRADSATMLGTLPLADEDYVKAGYIRVYQDIRGKYGSEGGYVMTRPVRGPLNPTKVDHVTDAWDTIDWLVKNVPESNGRVGMIGSSYEGFTVAMALLDPHPALRAAVPESPMVDGWMGDDWFHYGAFRQPNMDYFVGQTAQRGEGEDVPREALDDYETFMKYGSPGAYAKAKGLDQLPWWKKLSAHPAYDQFWQGQDLAKLLAAKPSSVPTMWEQGLWDQEDMWGANHAFAALKAAGRESNNWLVMGPWFHSQVNRDGSSLGVFHWNGDTALQFRREMVLPFFNQYLKDGPPANLARATVYNPALNRWERFDSWPTASALKPLYLQSDFGLSFDKPAAPAKGAKAGDSYVSDPAKPVTYLPRPVKFSDTDAWRTWLVRDQRFVDGRPDVLVYSTPVLTSAVKIQGAPIADIVAATTGTDGDFVVKLIDVYPPEYPSQPELGGYELPVATDIFRGRYRESFVTPSPIPAGKPQHYRFELPNQNYTFLPGHRIMVQIQSTLFPLYDRNPQTYVANPLLAQPADYKAQTVTVMRSPDQASAVYLPVVP
jgi:putative CocE/NonD family hydrolase